MIIDNLATLKSACNVTGAQFWSPCVNQMFEQRMTVFVFIEFQSHVEGILTKGPYPPCLPMAGRALLAGYPRCEKLGMECVSETHFSLQAENQPSCLLAIYIVCGHYVVWCHYITINSLPNTCNRHPIAPQGGQAMLVGWNILLCT